MSIRVRFYDETKTTSINEWTLCKVENSVTLFSLYDKICNGEIEFETYDVDKMWAESSAINNNLPLENEMFRTPLNFSVEDLQDNRKKVFIIFHVTPYTSLYSSLTPGGNSGLVIEIPSNTETSAQKCAFDMLLSASRKECVPDRKTGKKRHCAV